ncbi:hypothetical protein AMTRI_Chr09g16360 [Amborella trichopoda]
MAEEERGLSIDPYKHLNIIPNKDGSLTRATTTPDVPPICNAQGRGEPRDGVLSKDVALNPAQATWIRIFAPHRPEQHHDLKLPVIIYMHGGGFILCSAATAPFDAFNATMAREVPAIVVSVNYRLAPEHPLPAAYDDALDALRFVAAQADPWLAEFADLSRCFLMGSSAGGNMVYHVALRALNEDLGQAKVVGLIMNQPYFGGAERTESELRLANDPIVPLASNDLMWELALPKGADREHEFCNPMKPSSAVGRLPRCMVWGHEGDPLSDRQKSFAEFLEGERVVVVARFLEGGSHAVELFDPRKARYLLSQVKHFVESTGVTANANI